jgi:UDP-N-acetylglucosamine 2-epimerase (non-hydrolysing)
MRIPVVHVEAGLRTHSTLSPFPEELNRQLITRIASFHLAPTTVNKESLVLEGVRNERVFVSGNTGLDALRFAATLELPIDEPAVHDAVESPDPLVVVTAHRRENWNGGLARIAEAIGQLASRHADTRFVVPLHPNPLVRRELGEPLAAFPNVVCSEPLAYAQFARLLARATVVITDSGGIQEEAPALGVPVLVARESTERDEGVDAGVLTLVGTDPAHIVAAAERILDDPKAHVVDASANPYGDGRAAERLVAALEYLAGVGPPPERFGPGFSRRAVLQAAGYGRLLDEPLETRNAQPDRQDEHDAWVGR